MCAIASGFLTEILRERGFDATLENTRQHAWVQCGEYLVDITAAQFGGPCVSIRRKRPTSIRSFKDWSFGQLSTARRNKNLRKLLD